MEAMLENLNTALIASLTGTVVESIGMTVSVADFPAPVGDALAMIAAEDPLGYVEAVESVLESFEARDDYLEDLPVADTVMVLQALAARRGMAVELSSPLLPRSV